MQLPHRPGLTATLAVPIQIRMMMADRQLQVLQALKEHRAILANLCRLPLRILQQLMVEHQLQN